MSTFKRNSFLDLSDQEMNQINGGRSMFFKLGQAANDLYCDIKDAWKDYCSNPHSSYGSYAGMKK